MIIIEKNINELIPYENNPRNNAKAIDYVANSIKEFGFKVPIIIDKNNVIVAGHTRVLASKKIGLEVVPCIVADDLTEEQIKAYRLADNKVSEYATWDFELLSEELSDILDINMNDFGFATVSEIDWDSVTDLSEENYEEPEYDKLRCPVCGAVDYKTHFKKANKGEGEE